VPETFDEQTRALLDGKSFATVATLGPDGAPQTSVVWVVRDGDAVLFSTTVQRQKGRNLARDPRLSMTVFDPANPYVTVELRGTAELIDDPGKALSRTVTHKYLNQDPPAEPADVLRLIVRVVPDKIVTLAV
jgi:PPOX class probable F420-dependent enzyme